MTGSPPPGSRAAKSNDHLVHLLELAGWRPETLARRVSAALVELPGPKVTKDIATDAKVRLEVPRAKFNDLATKGHIADWRAAFEHGDAKVTGIDQIIKLIVNVVERQEERARTRHAKTH